MKLTPTLALAITLLVACKKENAHFIAQYQGIPGTWMTQAISHDSSGIRVTHTSVYNKLIIGENLTYQISNNSVLPVENGRIEIITQCSDKLELYFAAKYPSYSSFAGSHLFGVTNVTLVSVTQQAMILKSVNTVHFQDMEFSFTRQ
jgi:hypothetical protein